MTAAARLGAAVDVGSNSIHLLIAAVGSRAAADARGRERPAGLRVRGGPRGPAWAPRRGGRAWRCSPGYVDAGAGDGCRRRSRSWGPSRCGAPATARVFQAEVLRATGVPLHVLSHEEEAELTLLGVTAGRRPPRRCWCMDIGGGSTELIVAAPERDAGRGRIADRLVAAGRRVHRARPAHLAGAQRAPRPGHPAASPRCPGAPGARHRGGRHRHEHQPAAGPAAPGCARRDACWSVR